MAKQKFEVDKIDAEKQRESARRVRDARIKRHDPGPKVKDVDWNPDRSRRKGPPNPLLIELWGTLPAKYRGAIIGMIFGMFALVPAMIFLDGLLKCVGLPIMVGCMVVVAVIWSFTEEKV